MVFQPNKLGFRLNSRWLPVPGTAESLAMLELTATPGVDPHRYAIFFALTTQARFERIALVCFSLLSLARRLYSSDSTA